MQILNYKVIELEYCFRQVLLYWESRWIVNFRCPIINNYIRANVQAHFKCFNTFIMRGGIHTCPPPLNTRVYSYHTMCLFQNVFHIEYITYNPTKFTLVIHKVECNGTVFVCHWGLHQVPNTLARTLVC